MNVPSQPIDEISRRHFQLQGILLACGLAVLLAACSSGSINKLTDSMPASIGGLPADTPERPEVQPAYPAVHDMPPPRPNTTLSAEEQVKLENELTAIRVRQEVITGTAPAAPKRAQAPAAAPAPSTVPAVSTNSIY